MSVAKLQHLYPHWRYSPSLHDDASIRTVTRHEDSTKTSEEKSASEHGILGALFSLLVFLPSVSPTATWFICSFVVLFLFCSSRAALTGLISRMRLVVFDYGQNYMHPSARSSVRLK
ncbi:hypothetical protein FRB91_004337 [Serendipita sp. 411]|nr:hypothetical protein FRB91_004337 [Serendipita sp. 411]